MARPQKRGLDYFSLDVDIFEDDKLFDVQNEFGPLGEVIYLRLLCLIYRNGYYYQFESLDKLSAMLIKSIGNKWTRDKQVVRQVILFLAKCNLFSSELMRENVLTSARIQKQYLEATGRRQPLKSYDYWIIEKNDNPLITAPKNAVSVVDNGVYVYNNLENVCNSTQRKEKENKVNKIDRSSVVKDLLIYLDTKLHVSSRGAAADFEYFLSSGMQEEVIKDAIAEAEKRGKPYSYAQGIMRNRLEEGKLTMKDVERSNDNGGNGKPIPEHTEDSEQPWGQLGVTLL